MGRQAEALDTVLRLRAVLNRELGVDPVPEIDELQEAILRQDPALVPTEADVLMLLAEEPMHGYQLMQAIADRSDGHWTPQPRRHYPTINQLEDEDLVAVTAERPKLVALTDAGREYVETRRETTIDPFAGFASTEPATDLRALLEELRSATRQVARSGSEEQRTAAAKILAEARRSIYLLLADAPVIPETRRHPKPETCVTQGNVSSERLLFSAVTHL